MNINTAQRCRRGFSVWTFDICRACLSVPQTSTELFNPIDVHAYCVRLMLLNNIDFCAGRPLSFNGKSASAGFLCQMTHRRQNQTNACNPAFYAGTTAATTALLRNGTIQPSTIVDDPPAGHIFTRHAHVTCTRTDKDYKLPPVIGVK